MVADRERDAVTGLHAPGRDDLGERVRAPVELAEREGATVPDECQLLGGAARAGFEAPGEVLRHGAA